MNRSGFVEAKCKGNPEARPVNSMQKFRQILGTAFIFLTVGLMSVACGQAPSESPTLPFAVPTFTPPNLPSITLGGEQFWSDEVVRHGWRVQINALTGHHRLLDQKEVRRAWGDHATCVAALNETALREAWPPPKKKAVITMHGLIRSRDTMEGIGAYLAKEGDYEWVNIGYASTRRTVDQHAESLAKIIAGLDGVEEINFVCHSLGNIVVRRYLGEASAAEPKWKPDPRIKRLVMLGPPNNGAELAKRFKGNKLVAMVLGSSGKLLAGEWDVVSTRLAVPKCEFGIIAGGNGTDAGAHGLIAGDDDAVVAVAETRLPGACDFRVVNLLHGQLMNDPQVRNYTLNFLQKGCFEAPELRQPITVPDMPKTRPEQGTPQFRQMP
ncbi:Alpha/beta hydrolase family protein [Anatilimnocola aggregata]|uniref:Alpha/beta hydrolase family protein n=1 Tax=Anatilimnocola aggregata TaxID=2528021 RepID=A0A517Y5B5_9BACT|nr:hypothetical protein [Anatilimnocola aggregata]QDU25428.1 Alpha/beta hydrolase family protein [Anatilimnocola aggregata]